MPAEVKLPDESLYNTEPEPEIPFETPAETVKPAAAEKQEAVSATSKNVAASSVIPTGANADASSVIPTEANADASSVIPTGANAVSAAEGSSPAKKKEYEKPPLDLLKESKKSKGIENELEIQELKKQLVDTLKSFGVSAEVMAVSQGPSVTRFELKLGEGIKVNKIVNLADDLKLNLAAEEIRIEAPIPGKAAVGIEIPNKERIPVSLRELIGSKEFKKAESKLSFAVGKDIGGQVIIGDIAKMPHLLIAGTTGSGKSVFTNSIIQSILFNAEPEEVKLILIDPKVVEFSVYNGIPHLLMPVVTDPRKANTALAWAVAEMERRYKLFADHEVRGLNAYNELVAAGKITDENGEPVEALSRLVIVVDELADLMMVAGKEVEGSICRIAQLARAAGIHLVIATQRPSVDVITGLIKANMPSRVGLKCGSGIDSRTILDSVGAEKLLGYGDMLYLPQGFNKPLRVQGAFVSDEEVQKVVEFLKNNTAKEQVYDEKVIEEMNAISTTKQAEQPQEEEGDASPADDVDEYFDEACRVVVEKGKASSGMLQRVYKIGFNRAARILDQMESKGVVGPEEGTKPRKVLMTAEQLEQFIKERKG
ncbi:MAG: DNA translocase FtsK [Lachnospiraceae bacterium]|nr:DNA translocase FtsK [Lachnospiraceae bacterium]